ncbi:hypothetical protein GCM10012275_52840 [Longimycelium tulufanense]|uniref:Uncharacterized protein n=1 Tax=Longimycelium tulufanense TaxID=907463 RepID=A0A8J3CCX2_9PSEU|nr:hypothetical protein [Longimycelium tulufanense]GGM75578.1 hypothetical protein GCM10012275_52840 [Longimycelium tulufanense]
MTPAQFARLRRLLSLRLLETLAKLFLGLGSWRDADADRFVRQAVPLVFGAQRSLAALAATFVAAQASDALGRPIAPPGIPDEKAIDLRHSVDAAEVYRRPFVEARRGLAGGKTLDEAVQLGAVRLREIAEADLQQTYAHASQVAMERLPAGFRPRYWRRVLQGEENCALCVVASTQRYHVKDLNPIHPACDCQVRPILTREDPGQVIEPELLEQVHSAVEALTGKADRGARAPDYRQLLVQMTPEHGELGRMLVRPRDRFTGPDDLRAS